MTRWYTQCPDILPCHHIVHFRTLVYIIKLKSYGTKWSECAKEWPSWTEGVAGCNKHSRCSSSWDAAAHLEAFAEKEHFGQWGAAKWEMDDWVASHVHGRRDPSDPGAMGVASICKTLRTPSPGSWQAMEFTLTRPLTTPSSLAELSNRNWAGRGGKEWKERSSFSFGFCSKT